MSANPTEQPDEQIVARILGGEVDLFEILYLRYHPKACRFAFRMTGRWDEAEDLAQDILARLYRSLHKFRAESSFATWFYRIALNHCLNDRRRAKIIEDVTEDLDQFPIYSIRSVESAADEVLRHEIQREVQQALLSLPPQMRAVAILKDIEGLGYEELAEHFQCSKGTIASRLSRARELLAKKLQHLRGEVQE